MFFNRCFLPLGFSLRQYYLNSIHYFSLVTLQTIAITDDGTKSNCKIKGLKWYVFNTFIEGFCYHCKFNYRRLGTTYLQQNMFSEFLDIPTQVSADKTACFDKTAKQSSSVYLRTHARRITSAFALINPGTLLLTYCGGRNSVGL